MRLSRHSHFPGWQDVSAQEMPHSLAIPSHFVLQAAECVLLISRQASTSHSHNSFIQLYGPQVAVMSGSKMLPGKRQIIGYNWLMALQYFNQPNSTQYII